MSDKTPRVFSEDEHMAILADRVTQETASLNTQVTDLSTENSELASKLDAAEVAKAAAEKAAADVQAAFDEFKANLDAEKASEARKTERLAALEGLTLPEGFLKDEARVNRIAKMEDEAYNEWLADIKESAAAVTPTKVDGLPAETAMAGTQVTAPTVTDNAKGTAPAATKFLFPTLTA
jgi:chromosome segregation ATPase